MTHFNTDDSFGHYPPAVIIMLTLVICLLGSMIGGGILFGWAAVNGITITDLVTGLDENAPLDRRNEVRCYTMLNHLTTFVLPALLTAAILFRSRLWSWLRLHRSPTLRYMLVGAALMIAAFPLVQLSLWVNQQFPLPDWMTSMEEDTGAMIKGLLLMESPVELLFNLLIIAVLPGIGEELIFRGLIQQSLQKWLRSPHLAIWVTAAVFSAIHFQFEGFLPRMILGALLGYLFYWTHNLWIPIFAHFVTNGLQVVGAFFTKDLIGEIEGAEATPNWIAVLLSVALVIFIIRYFQQQYAKTEQSVT
ncbi:MAG: type II CAAX endopeptidase family protein [Bacteroidota bacterium]